MQITETAKIKLVIDGKESINQLSEIENKVKSLTQKRDEYAKGTKEWKEYNDQIKEQAKLYKTVEERLDVMKMSYPQLISYQRDLIKAIKGGNEEAAEKIKDVNTRLAEMKGVMRATHEEADKQPGIWDRAKGAFMGFLAAFTLEAAISMLRDFAMTGIQKAAELSDAFGTIMKTTGMAKDEVRALNTEVEKIDSRTVHTELTKIAEVGGQIGVAKEEMLGFVEATDMAVVALGDEFSGGTEEVTKKLGTMKTLFKETKDLQFGDAIQKIGSSLNELGATGLATGPVIAEFTSRMGQLGDLSPQITQVMGLGAAFQELGLPPEISSGGLSNIILTAAKDTETFAKQVGITNQEFVNLINTNPNKMLLDLAASFKGMGADELAKRLDDLGIKSQEATKVMSLLRDQTAMVEEKQRIANVAYTEGISLKKEFNVMNQTEQAQLEKSAKAIEAQQRALGEKLLPAYIKWNEAKAEGIGLLGKYGGAITQFTIAAGSVMVVMKAWTAVQQIKSAWDLKNITSLGSLTVAERVGLVLKGQWILATQGQAVATGTLTTAQLRATTAAQSFNTAMNSNAILLAASAALYVVYEAFQQYNEAVETANKMSFEHIKLNDEEIKSEQIKATQMDISFKSAEKLTKGTEERKNEIQKLINAYPEYFGNLTAEQVSNNDLIRIYRTLNSEIQNKINLMAREKQQAAQVDRMVTINNRLDELGIDVNTIDLSQFKNHWDGLRELRNKTHKEWYSDNREAMALLKEYAGINSKITETNVKLNTAQNKVMNDEVTASARRLQTGQITLEQYKAEIISIEKKNKVVLTSFQAEAEQQKKNAELQNKLYAADVEGNEKKNKAKAKQNEEAAKEDTAIIEEWIKLGKEFRELDLKHQTDFNEAKQQLIEKYGTADLKRIKELEKKKDVIEKLEEERTDRLFRAQVTYFKEVENETEKHLEKLQNEREKDNKKMLELTEKGLELIQQKKKEDSEKTAENLKFDYDQITKFQADKLKSEWKNAADLALLKETAKQRELISQEMFGEKFENLTEQQQKKVNKKVKKGSDERQEIIDKSFTIINASVDAALTVFSTLMSTKYDEANSETERALIENAEMWVKWGAQATSVVLAWTKDWVSGLAATVAWAGQGIANLFTANKRKAAAALKDLQDYNTGQIEEWENFMDKSQSAIEKYYGEYMDLVKVAQEYTKAIKEYDPKFVIDNELVRAQTISDTYTKAVGLEKDYHSQILSNINEQYNKRIEAINKEFDARAAREKQGYDAGSLAIEENLTLGLLKFLENEDSKTSILAEFDKKRSEIIQATALADTQIVEGMSQAEIDAINAAKDLRAQYFLDLQKWLNAELEFTISNEGQKRKEYSETEKLKKEAQDAHELNDLNYSMIQIQRNKEKNEAIVAAEKEKNGLIETESIRHNDEITRITLARDEALKASWAIVTEAMLAGYQAQMDAAIKAYQYGAMTLEQLRAMAAEVNNILSQAGAGSIDLNNKLTAGNSEIDSNVDSQVGDRHKFIGWGSNTQSEYLSHLNDKGLSDSRDSRIDFVNKKFSEWFNEQSWANRNGVNPFWNPEKKFNEHWENAQKYATGTEYVDKEGQYPAGVDKVPAMLTKAEGVLNVADNREKLAMGLTNKGLIEMARLGVVARNQGMIKAIKNSSISTTGMPAFATGTHTMGTPLNRNAGLGESKATEQLLIRIATILENNTTALDELKELKQITKAVKEKPVLSLEKINREQEADELNKRRSSFA